MAPSLFVAVLFLFYKYLCKFEISFLRLSSVMVAF